MFRLEISSESNLFKYLSTQCGDTEREKISFRIHLLEFLKEFIVTYSSYCVNYFHHIKKKCDGIYRVDKVKLLKKKY